MLTFTYCMHSVCELPESVLILSFFIWYSFDCWLSTKEISIKSTAGFFLQTSVTDEPMWINRAVLVPAEDSLVSEYLNRWTKCQPHEGMNRVMTMRALYTMSDFLRWDGLIQKSPPPLEARETLMRWGMVMAPVKMTELMITMKVAIILIKWDEIWQEEMIFRVVLRCAISQMHRLAVSSPHQCPSSNIYKRTGSQNTDKKLFARLIFKPHFALFPFSQSIFSREPPCVPKSADLFKSPCLPVSFVSIMFLLAFVYNYLFIVWRQMQKPASCLAVLCFFYHTCERH